jgi:hypothetical protein
MQQARSVKPRYQRAPDLSFGKLNGLASPSCWDGDGWPCVGTVEAGSGASAIVVGLPAWKDAWWVRGALNVATKSCIFFTCTGVCRDP